MRNANITVSITYFFFFLPVRSNARQELDGDLF